MRVISINQNFNIGNNHNYDKNVSSNNKTGVLEKLSVISFTGNKNKNQAAFLSLEVSPVLAKGGLAENTEALPFELNKMNMDTRVFVPLFDTKNSLKSEGNGNYTYTNEDKQSFKLKDTGISADIRYGLKRDSAKLFKVEDDKVKTPTYMVYCENSASHQKGLYKGNLSEQAANNSAFCTAAVELIKKMDNEKEKFNPKFLVSNDWTTSFIYSNGGVNDFDSKDDFRTVHIINNGTIAYNGLMPPSVAAANVFSPKESLKIVQDEDFKKCAKYINSHIDGAIDRLKGLKFDDEIKNNDYQGALVKIADNYETLDTMFHNEISAVDYFAEKHLQSKYINPENHRYNPMKNAIENASYLVALSPSYLKDMQEEYAPSGGLNMDYKRARWKSAGIISGIDLNKFNPSVQSPNPNKKIKALYDVKTFEEGKKQNKLYLQETLSKENSGKTNIYGVKQKGYLERSENAFIGTLLTRFDKDQKGVDLFIDAAATYLHENPNAQLILGGAGFDNNDYMIKRFEDVTNNFKGRAVLLDGNIQNTNQFYAASDIVVFPNRIAPSEIAQTEAMRYGAIPVTSNVGALKDVVVDVRDDEKNATGFKTRMSVNKAENPAYEIHRAMNKATKMHGENRPLWNNIVRNAMNYKREFTDVAREYKQTVFDNPVADTDILRFYSLDDKVYRGSQPGKCKGGNVTFKTNLDSLDKDMEFLQKQGFTTIIDFRKKDFEGEYPRIEGEYAAKHGIKHVHMPMDGGKCPTEDELKTFFDAIDNSKGKVMFHCRAGVDRTGMMASVYMTSRMGMNAETAMKKAFDDVALPRFYYMHPKTRENMVNLLNNLHESGRYSKRQPVEEKHTTTNIHDIKKDISKLDELMAELSK